MLVPFEVKLARFRAVKRHPSGKSISEYDESRKNKRVAKRKQMRRRRYYRAQVRAQKRNDREEIRALLAIARELLKRERQQQ